VFLLPSHVELYAGRVIVASCRLERGLRVLGMSFMILDNHMALSEGHFFHVSWQSLSLAQVSWAS